MFRNSRGDILFLRHMEPTLHIQNYTYNLPPDRIALFPMAERDQSRLLVYRKGTITHRQFAALPDFLPEKSLLVFNNTRVIQARIIFQKDSGANIEVFLLNPVSPSSLLLETMQARKTCTWKCTIGNLKRWKQDNTLKKTLTNGMLHATLNDREKGEVTFNWDNDQSFAEILSESGNTPLPPYLKRQAEKDDKDRYQTIYGVHDGAVAAPTAGLHFTPGVFDELEKRNIKKDFVTLHVSAGTFQPIKEENAIRHVMHQEQVVITRSNIETLLANSGPVIPVGTTSMRTLESVYWFGVKLSMNSSANFEITQDDAYVLHSDLHPRDALSAVLSHMEKTKSEILTGETSIYIRPGYTFRLCDGLITNFHQPGSTLILLVAAFIGEDWRSVYREAIENDYRFLSYGDSSLLIP
jgi:S-adenosylmethionine:tRNA ribosyltransferase-isomerase